METIQFKTNIKCTGCLAQVTPYLNEEVGEGHWKVDLENPERILTVDTDSTANEVAAAVKEAGFVAEEIKALEEKGKFSAY